MCLCGEIVTFIGMYHVRHFVSIGYAHAICHAMPYGVHQ